MAMSSACAVGSRSAIVRLPACAITSPPRTITQPTGTSPRLPAARASANAMSMNEVIIIAVVITVMAGLVPATHVFTSLGCIKPWIT